MHAISQAIYFLHKIDYNILNTVNYGASQDQSGILESLNKLIVFSVTSYLRKIFLNFKQNAF